eukprot:460293-Prorocentrum_minimum.AAC.1
MRLRPLHRGPPPPGGGGGGGRGPACVGDPTSDYLFDILRHRRSIGRPHGIFSGTVALLVAHMEYSQAS